MESAFLGEILDVLWTSLGRETHKVGGIKTSLVTTLSMVGVLATGGAAFAANTTVLDSIMSSVQSSPRLAEAEEEAIVLFADLSIESSVTGRVVVVDTVVDTTVLDPTVSSVPTGTTLPVTELPISSTTSVAPAVTSATTVAPASVQIAYNVAGVGIITLKQDATSLKVVSVKPVSGWTYEAKNEYATRVEIEFENGNKSVKFRAELLDGRVIAAVSVDDEVDNDDEAVTAAEMAAKATFDAAEKAAKATFDAAEKTAKEANDEAAVTAAKESYEATVRAAKESYEDADD